MLNINEKAEGRKARISVEGHAKVQLFDHETGRLEFEIEKSNMFFPRVVEWLVKRALTHHAIEGLFWSFRTPFPTTKVLSLAQGEAFSSYFRMHSALVLSESNVDVTEDEDGFTNGIIGGAYVYAAYAGSSPKLGTLNLTESLFDPSTGTLKIVVDFPTNAANGTFQSISILPARDNQGTQATAGYLLGCGAWVPEFPTGTKGLIKSSVIAAGSGMTGEAYNGTLCIKNGKLLIKGGPASYNIWEVDMETGDGINLGYSLKNSAGTAVQARGTVAYNGFLWGVGSSSRVYKWDLANLNANAVEYNLTSILPFSGEALVCPSNIATNIFVFPFALSTNDPAMAEPYQRFIYEINVVSNTIVRRIRVGIQTSNYLSSTYTKGCMWLDKTDPSTLYVAKLNKAQYQNDNIGEDGLMQSYSNSGSSVNANSVTIRKYDLTNEEYVGSLSDLSSVFVLNGTSHFGGIFYDYNDNKLKIVPYDSETMLSLREVVFAGKTHRVVLPAPVTKVNTQTMKVTYNLVVDPTTLLNFI